MNIVIYSETGASDLANFIKLDDETELREFDLSELENYKQYNPGVIIFDMELDKVREFCAVRKLECCVLIPANEIPQNLTVRALSYDFIKKPVNETELNVRLNALLKTYVTKRELIKTAICDELTGLYNRKYLHHRLEAEISRSKRYGTPVSCLLLDIEYKNYIKEELEEIAKKLAEITNANIVLTGVSFEESKLGALVYNNETKSIDYYFTDKVPAMFHGTGDCFASALFGALIKGYSLIEANKIACEFTAKAISNTYEDKDVHWYGVHFESALKYLTNL